ncbi:hypothetical protein Barb7_00997 [Bacteroidales bacterium Barb7]|nr:hypothetical protein Barb7_00997 [Bacteroidales bacterium Barb7]
MLNGMLFFQIESVRFCPDKFFYMRERTMEVSHKTRPILMQKIDI